MFQDMVSAMLEGREEQGPVCRCANAELHLLGGAGLYMGVRVRTTLNGYPIAQEDPNCWNGYISAQQLANYWRWIVIAFNSRPTTPHSLPRRRERRTRKETSKGTGKESV